MGGARVVVEHRRDWLIYGADHHHAVVRGRKAQRDHGAAGYIASDRYRNHSREVDGGRDSIRRHAWTFAVKHPDAVRVWQTGLEADADRLSGAAAAGSRHAGFGRVYLGLHEESDRRGGGRVWRPLIAVGHQLGVVSGQLSVLSGHGLPID